MLGELSMLLCLMFLDAGLLWVVNSSRFEVSSLQLPLSRPPQYVWTAGRISKLGSVSNAGRFQVILLIHNREKNASKFCRRMCIAKVALS